MTSLTSEVGYPDEDFDERDHRNPRRGADRPAIIQTGTEIVPPRIARGETITSAGVVGPDTKSKPSRGRVSTNDAPGGLRRVRGRK